MLYIKRLSHRYPLAEDIKNTKVNGSQGRKKKRLDINKAESDVVHSVYDLYLYGNDGVEIGCKEIVMYGGFNYEVQRL